MTEQQKPKKLSMKHVKQQHSKFDEQINVTFHEDGQEFYVNVKPFISNSSISKVIELFKVSLDQWESDGFEINDEHFWGLLYYSLIKVQSDLTTPKNPKDDIQYYTIMIDQHYFKEILSVIPEFEQAKLIDVVLELIKTDQKIQGQITKVQQEIQNLELQSPELREKVQGKKETNTRSIKD